MVTWRRLGPEQLPVWEALLDRAEDATLFQAAAWGELKRGYGWMPELWVTQGGEALAGMQVLLKRLPLGRVLAWAPGGPMTVLPGCRPELAGELMRSWLRQFRAARGVYARFRLHRPASAEWAQGLSGALARPPSRINSPVTIHLDLTLPVERLRAKFSSKHRYYVRQAEASSIEWASGHDPALAAQFAALYEQMAAAKALSLFEPGMIPRLGQLFGDRAVFLIGSLKAEPVTGCLVVQTGKAAFYLMAATSPAGRDVSAAYAMVPRLLELLKAAGVERFDFGGIDPGNEKARGVDHFKKGFGGETVEYLGEWDWAPWEWLRRAANAAIARRLR